MKCQAEGVSWPGADTLLMVQWLGVYYQSDISHKKSDGTFLIYISHPTCCLITNSMPWSDCDDISH